jgi:hypothetical protein
MDFVRRVVCAVLLLHPVACDRAASDRSGEAPSPEAATGAVPPAPETPAAAPERTPSAPAAPASPAAGPGSNRPSTGTAELTFSGGVTQKLDGPLVVCGHTFIDGRHQGGTWAVRTDAFDFQIMATTDEEFAEPSVVLNAKQPARKSYVWKRKAGTVSAASDRTVASIDADLHEVVGAGTVHVTGKMTCPAR